MRIERRGKTPEQWQVLANTSLSFLCSVLAFPQTTFLCCIVHVHALSMIISSLLLHSTDGLLPH